MDKTRSLAKLILAFACLLLIACQTGATPKQSDGTAGGSAAGDQAPPRAVSAVQNRPVSYTVNVRSVARVKDRTPIAASAPPPAQPRDLTGKAVDKTLSSAADGEMTEPVRAILYAAVAVILVGALGAITTGLDGRYRRLAPPSSAASR